MVRNINQRKLFFFLFVILVSIPLTFFAWKWHRPRYRLPSGIHPESKFGQFIHDISNSRGLNITTIGIVDLEKKYGNATKTITQEKPPSTNFYWVKIRYEHLFLNNTGPAPHRYHVCAVDLKSDQMWELRAQQGVIDFFNDNQIKIESSQDAQFAWDLRRLSYPRPPQKTPFKYHRSVPGWHGIPPVSSDGPIEVWVLVDSDSNLVDVQEN